MSTESTVKAIEKCITEVINYRHQTLTPELSVAIAEEDNYRATMFIEPERFSIHVHLIKQSTDAGFAVFNRDLTLKGGDGYPYVVREIREAVEHLQVLQQHGLIDMQKV